MSIFSRHQTDGFKICKISSNVSFHPQLAVKPAQPDELILAKQALAQPFSYLAKGSQTFVFLSEDQNYVIKLIRYNHIRPSLWDRLTSKEKCAALDSKLQRDFTSYKIAYEQLKEETGLVFLHLSKTDYLHQKLTLVDKIGIAHTLDLDHTDFILQKRVQPFYPYLKNLMDKNKEEDAKIVLSHLVSLLFNQYKKGIINTDVDLFKNFGCLDKQAVELDIGSLRQDIPSHDIKQYQEEILKVTDCLHNKLSQEFPSLDSHLLQELANDKVFI